MRPEPPDNFESLWEEFLAGRCNDEGAQALLDYFEANPEALDARRNEASVNAGLSCLLAPRSSTKRLVASVQARIKNAPAGQVSGKFAQQVMAEIQREAAPRRATVQISKRMTQRHRRAERSNPATAIAALLFLGLIGAAAFYALKKAPEVSPEPKPEVVKNEVKTMPAPQALATLIARGTGVEVDNVAVSAGAIVPLKAGSSIKLCNNAAGLMKLSDGSVFDFADSAQATLLAPQNGPRIKLDDGRCSVHAMPQAPGTSLRIQTRHAEVRVVGTQFSVQAYQSLSWVAVRSGKVAVGAPENKVEANSKMVGAGEEVIADSSGVGEVHRTGEKRVITIANGTVEEFADPTSLKDIPERTFRDLPLRAFSYHRPKGKEKFGYSGEIWPLRLAPGEDKFEVWLRPSRIDPIPRDYNLIKICLLVNIGGDTQYMIGEIPVKTEERDWLRLEGKLSSAKLHWARDEKNPAPLKADAITGVVLRVDMGEADFEHTPVSVWGK